MSKWWTEGGVLCEAALALKDLLHLHVAGHVRTEKQFFASSLDHGVQSAAHVFAPARTHIYPCRISGYKNSGRGSMCFQKATDPRDRCTQPPPRARPVRMRRMQHGAERHSQDSKTKTYTYACHLHISLHLRGPCRSGIVVDSFAAVSARAFMSESKANTSYPNPGI